MDDSTVFARLFFYWVMPLMARGVEGRLTHPDNLFDLPIHLTPSSISRTIEGALESSPDASQNENNFRRGTVDLKKSIVRYCPFLRRLYLNSHLSALSYQLKKVLSGSGLSLIHI